MAVIAPVSGSSPACEFHVYIETYARCVVLAQVAFHGQVPLK